VRLIGLITHSHDGIGLRCNWILQVLGAQYNQECPPRRAAEAKHVYTALAFQNSSRVITSEKYRYLISGCFHGQLYKCDGSGSGPD
jgi:hypothetical protein